jgi:hypothetical protein
MRADRWLVLEAAALVALVRAAFRLTSFAATRRLLERCAWRRSDPPHATAAAATAARVGAATRAAARRLPGTTCLVEALTAETMLRRRGVESTLHIGVRAPAPATPLDAHAWLECAGLVVVGDAADLAQYRILTRPS